MPDGRTPRPAQRIAAYRQQAAAQHPPQQDWSAPDPTAASQALIMRYHPEHLDPKTGTYRTVPW